MKRDAFTLQLDLRHELIIDNFAGGGGTLTGLQAAADPLQLPRVPLTKSAQVRMCGNSVCPPVSEALIRANFVHEQQLAREAA